MWGVGLIIGPAIGGYLAKVKIKLSHTKFKKLKISAYIHKYMCVSVCRYICVRMYVCTYVCMVSSSKLSYVWGHCLFPSLFSFFLLQPSEQYPSLFPTGSLFDVYVVLNNCSKLTVYLFLFLSAMSGKMDMTSKGRMRINLVCFCFLFFVFVLGMVGVGILMLFLVCASHSLLLSDLWQPFSFR
jgi:hypothetical protein